MNHARSEELFARSQRLLPGGVNSPVRSFGAVGGTPPFIARGEGARIWDVDTGMQVARWEGHRGGVSAVAFSPDGRRLATGSDDTTVLIWDVASARRGSR